MPLVLNGCLLLKMQPPSANLNVPLIYSNLTIGLTGLSRNGQDTHYWIAEDHNFIYLNIPGDLTFNRLGSEFNIGQTTYLPDIGVCENACRSLADCRYKDQPKQC